VRAFKVGERVRAKCGIWSSWGMRARRGDFLRVIEVPVQFPTFITVQMCGDPLNRFMSSADYFSHARQRQRTGTKEAADGKR
jgi:hypothetical protein